MKHTMSTPCDNCPFRSDLPHGYLREDRIYEITDSLFRGQSFPCHKTTEEVDCGNGETELAATERSSQCAGAEIFLAHHGQSTQMSRIASRLGVAVAELDMDSPVCSTVDELLHVHGVEIEE